MAKQPTFEGYKQKIAQLLEALQKAEASAKNPAMRNQVAQLAQSIRAPAEQFFPLYQEAMAGLATLRSQVQDEMQKAQQNLEEGMKAAAAASPPPPPPAPPPAPPQEVFVPLPGSKLREELLRHCSLPVPEQPKAAALDEGSVQEMSSALWGGSAPLPTSSRPPRPAPRKSTGSLPRPRPGKAQQSPPQEKPSEDIAGNDLSEMFKNEKEDE